VLPIAVAHDVDLAVVVGQRSEQVAVDFDEEVRAALYAVGTTQKKSALRLSPFL
jgi:hypothetical protein